MARTPTRLGRGSLPRSRQSLWALAVLVLGCSSRVSSENIALWKTTQKGPERLHDALADHSVAPKLRAEAAVALVDLGRSNEVDTILSGASADDRAEITKTLEPAYEVAMKDPAPEKALAYRDALYSLRQVAAPDDQKRIDAALLPVLEAQLETGKVRQGEHSLDKMLTAIGPDASAMLVRVLAAPDQPYVQAAELLAKVGDETARNQGAGELIARAPKIKAKEKDHPELFYRALGTLGGPAAVKYLEGEVTGGKQESALLATRALGERRDPAVLPFALKVAADPKADKAVRDEMFGVIEGIGGLEAEKGLLGIISSDKEEIVRYRAFESELAARKAEGIIPGLEAFPASATYKKVDVDDLLVKLVEKLGPTAHPALVQALGSRVPLARMTAVMALAQMGGAADAAPLQKLATDSSPVKGFPAGDTVGKEAAQAAETVKKKILMALPGRKSLRQFQCNDTLWVTFRRMAEDQEKEVDDMIADAMEAYAQLSGYQTGINALESESQLTPPPSSAQHRQRPAPAAAPPPPLPPPPPAPPPGRSRFAQRMPQPGGVSMFDAPATPPPHPHGSNAQMLGAGLGAGLDGTPAVQPSIPVYLVFDNQKYRIDKDQFIIGRGTKSSDLPIKDGNISRKHAAVIRRNGTYFIKDLGSTNGIDFKGMRIDNKRIEEGDIFHLCDYELRFTFKR